ncbi:MAG: RNA-binding protein, partial [Chitinophagaceae bacterium]
DGFIDLVTLDMLSEDNYLQKTHAGPNAFDKSSYLISKGFQPQYMRNMLQKNNGDGTFSEIGQMAGISNTDWSWAALMCDFDGDMKKDLYISNGFVKDFSDLDFMVYSTDKLIKKRKGEDSGTFEETIEKMPTIKLSDYMFHNDSAGIFRNVTKEWGLAKPEIASGAAYADLDNDGDMDIIVNNSNQFAGVYRNNSRELEKNNYIRIKLEGSGKNTNGIGARVNVYCNGENLVQEQYPVRGYQSSVDMVLNFGLGKAAKVDSIRIVWPEEKAQLLRDVQVNQTIVVKGSEAVPFNAPDSVVSTNAMLRSADAFGMHHTENRFNDFTVQPLLLHYFSRQGPCMAKADINKDGLEDIFIGGAKGAPAQLYIQQLTGSFSLARQAEIAADSASEDVSVAFFDADNDGNMDLLVGSGGYEFDEDDALLQTRLYINNGKGAFTKAKDALPALHISTGCVKPADVDGDGDQDIFIGGRVVPG